jgi:VanZ family protein
MIEKILLTASRIAALIASWTSLALIAAATLSPLALRPHLFPVHAEHFAAFAVVGLLFCMAYPRRTFLTCAIVLGAATLLETLQLLTPDRHGRLSDMAVKLAGAMAGIVAGKLATRQIALRRRRSFDQ